MGIYDRFGEEVVVHYSACKTIIYQFCITANVIPFHFIAAGNLCVNNSKSIFRFLTLQARNELGTN